MNLRPRTAVVRFSTYDYGTPHESEEEVEIIQVNKAEPGQGTATSPNESKANESKKKKPRRRNIVSFKLSIFRINN